MAKSEAVREAEAKQKAAVRAAKERRKTSDDPRDWGQLRQIRELYKITSEHDKSLPPLLALALGGPILLAIVVAVLLVVLAHFAWYNVILIVLLGIAVGLLLATLVLRRRSEAAMFARVEGQAGSGEVALRALPKGWQSTPAIAFTKQQDVIHRALGPGGLVLIAEGEAGRLRPLLAQEVKRHERALYGITVQTVQMGTKEGQVPLKNLTKYLTKLPKQLNETQIAEAAKRIRGLDAQRSRMPVPKGPMPGRVNRSAMRGR